MIEKTIHKALHSDVESLKINDTHVPVRHYRAIRYLVWKDKLYMTVNTQTDKRFLSNQKVTKIVGTSKPWNYYIT